MSRMNKLFSMSNKLIKHNIKVILIQIDEAHSTEWPMSVPIIDTPEPHKSFDDRCARANYFVTTYNPPYPVFIDKFDNEFANIFRAWPDKYYLIDKNLVVIAKSEYHQTESELEATIIDDCTDVLERLCD